MRKGTLIIATMCLLGTALAQQCKVKEYTTKLVPFCDVKDMYIKWPNHEDQTTYHFCAGVGQPKLSSCPAGQVFTYVLQICTTCDRYVPSVPCESLPTQQPPKCVGIGSSVTSAPEKPESGYPTSHYPTGTPGEGSGNGENVEGETTVENEVTDEVTDISATLPTKIPPPPSPVPTDPNMPTPSTPLPTPPTAAATPPMMG